MNQILAQRLRIARERKNLKQVEVMQMTMINNKSLSGYKNGEEKLITLFKPVPVFDVSQTAGTPLPSMEFVKKLEGDTSLYGRCKKVCPFPVEEKENCGGANGYYSLSTQSIAILSTLQTVHKLKTLVHEWAHGLLHDEKNNKDNSTLKVEQPNRSLRELEAESTAFCSFKIKFDQINENDTDKRQIERACFEKRHSKHALISPNCSNVL